MGLDVMPITPFDSCPMKTTNTLPASPFSPVKTFAFAKGSREQTTQGRFVCNRYKGEFTERALQSKAETGLWYAYAQGTGLRIEGEGDTPETAIADMRKRAVEMRAELARVYGLDG